MKRIMKRLLLVIFCFCITLVTTDTLYARAASFPRNDLNPTTDIPDEIREYLEELGYDPDELINSATSGDGTYITSSTDYSELNALNSTPYEPIDWDEVGKTAKETIKDAKNLYDENGVVSGFVDTGINFARDKVIDQLGNPFGIIERFMPKSVAAANRAQMKAAEEASAKIAQREALLKSGSISNDAMKNFLRNTEKLKTRNAQGLTKVKIAKGFNLAARYVGAGLAFANAVSDGTDLVYGNYYTHNPIARGTEITLLAADFSLSVATAGMLLMGVACPTGLVVAGLVVGLATALVHNETGGRCLDSFFDGLLGIFNLFRKTPDGAGAYKPNIYFYNAEELDIDVVMGYPGLITESIPKYKDWWKIKVLDDDSHIQTVDGMEYGYLFYESMTSKHLFQTEEGLLIKADTRVEAFENILSAYGFNETEIADFIEFWDQKLDKETDYIMYPQYNDRVDTAMPIAISPMPVNIVRMWFAFEEDQGQAYEKADIQPFTHEGYTVVEWGGMIF